MQHSLLYSSYRIQPHNMTQRGQAPDVRYICSIAPTETAPNGSNIRGPSDHTKTKISHSGSKAQYKGYTRNHALQDPCVYVVFRAPKYVMCEYCGHLNSRAPDGEVVPLQAWSYDHHPENAL